MIAYLYVLGVLLAIWVLSGIMRGSTAARNPALDWDTMAATLGFRVTQGDPKYNLAVGPRGSLLLAMFGISRHELSVRAEGRAGPYPAALEVYDRWLRVRIRFVTLYEKDEFTAQLVVRTGPTAIPFEAWRVDAHATPAPRCGFPIIAQGVLGTGTWCLASPIAQARDLLGPIVQQLAARAPYLHVTATEGTAVMHFHRSGLPPWATQLPWARDELVRLAGIAAPRRPWG